MKHGGLGGLGGCLGGGGGGSIDRAYRSSGTEKSAERHQSVHCHSKLPTPNLQLHYDQK